MEPVRHLYFALTGIVMACRTAPLLEHIAKARDKLQGDKWVPDDLFALLDLQNIASLVPFAAWHERITPGVFATCVSKWLSGLRTDYEEARQAITRGGSRDIDAAFAPGTRSRTVALRADLTALRRAMDGVSVMFTSVVVDLREVRAQLESLRSRFERTADELNAAAELDALEALAVLNSQKVWTVDRLPLGVRPSALRVLDDDGFIEVRSRYWQRSPSPPAIQSDVWFSPIRSPTTLGTWEQIANMHGADFHTLPPELTVTDKGKAALARERRAGPPQNERISEQSRTARSTRPRSPRRGTAEAKTTVDAKRKEKLGMSLGGASGRESKPKRAPTPKRRSTREQERAEIGVVLRGRHLAPLVCGVEKRVLRTKQYTVVETLIGAGPKGLTKDDLISMSKCGDAWGILDRLCHDADWKRTIPFPGNPGGGYRVINGSVQEASLNKSPETRT
jgi:hypothetical protein